MEDRNIYALLVGIDRYKSPVPALEGCVNDMLAVKRFLQHRISPQKLNLVTLIDEEATRMNIVEKFETHLARAGKNDTAFFYYSGHGAQEPAHEVFWHIEIDQKNETLVCYDSRQPDGMDLADKELGTLIELVAQNGPHIVVIMDCCHSGSGTRAIADDPEAEFWPRQTVPTTLKRSLDSYILPRKSSLDRSAFISFNQPIVIPEARHVSLSASQSFELAKETRLGGERRGVFTYSLMEVLQNMRGNMSYAEILQRVHTLVTSRTYMQNPQLYALVNEDISLQFLGGGIRDKGEYYILSYTTQEGWFIDGGAVHGIRPPINDEKTTILGVYPEEVETRDMNPSTQIGQVAVTGVETAISRVALKGNLQLDKSQVYRAKLLTLPVEPLKVCIRGDDKEGEKLAQEALQKSPYRQYLEEVRNSKNADLNLIAKKDLKKYNRQPGDPPTPGYIINRPTDRDDQPLVEQIVGFTEEHALQAVEYLNHIARWKRILELSNPGSSIHSNAVRIDLFHASEDTLIQPQKGLYNFSYRSVDGSLALPQFRLKVVNTSHRRMYCVLLYLSSQFEIQTQLFGESGVWLDSGQEAWAINGKIFTAKVSENLVSFGKKEVQERFKLIISTKEYHASNLQQPALKEPKPRLRSATEVSDTRTLLFANSPAAEKQNDWTTNELTITIRRED